MKRFFAFTLAETLVVIGIIGIISALTLPNLNSSTGEKEKVVSLQKTYSELIEAISRAEIVYGPVGTWHLAGNSDNTNSIVVERIREFLKVSKFCGTTNPDNCFVYKIQQNNTMPTFILASGASILFSGVSNNCQKLNTTDVLNYCGTFLIDVDGPNKGKNVQAFDQFDFILTEENGLVPRGRERSDYNTATSCIGWHGECAEWVMNYGNMDYLKTDSSGKCPNGKILSATVTSCK